MSLYLASTCLGFYMLFWHNLLHWHFVRNPAALSSAEQALNTLITLGPELQLSSGTWRPCLLDLSAGVPSIAFAMLIRHSNLRN